MALPEKTLDKLSFLIGNWTTTGQILGLEGSPPADILGTDSYEWALDRQFILHNATVMMGEDKVEVVEYIGREGNDAFILYAFDNEGIVSITLATLNKEGNLILQGKGMRAQLQVGKGGNHMSAVWERSDDEITWTPWLTMNFNKD